MSVTVGTAAGLGVFLGRDPGSNTVNAHLRLAGPVTADGGLVLIQAADWSASGTLTAINGGRFELFDTVANTDNTLALAGGGQFNLDGSAVISGGRVTTTAGAVLLPRAGATLDGVTVDGDVQVRGNGTLRVQNGLTLNGTAWVGDGTSSGRISVEGTGLLGGSGTVWLNGVFTNWLSSPAPGGRVHHRAGRHSVRPRHSRPPRCRGEHPGDCPG